MYFEFFKFLIYIILIIVISKYLLVETVRKLAVSLNLKSSTVGQITGFSTSMPEFLTIITSSLRGLAGTGIYNILSSNIINFFQYIFTISFNKNIKKLNNIAIKISVVLVVFTILIPLLVLKYKIQNDVFFVLIFILLYVFFGFINKNAHKKYFGNFYNNNDENRLKKRDIRRVIKYVVILIIIGVMLFLISVLLGNSLEKLCLIFNIPQIIVGIILGVATSIPELITFFESQRFHNAESKDMLGVIEATNNLLTSNTLNLFIIQSIGFFIMTIV